MRIVRYPNDWAKKIKWICVVLLIALLATIGMPAAVTRACGVLDHFVFDIISDQVSGIPFSISIRAVDNHGNTVDYYNGSADLSTLYGIIHPLETTSFIAGVWTGTVSITISKAYIYDNMIMASDKFDPGITGTSNAFAINLPTSHEEQDEYRYFTVDFLGKITKERISSYGRLLKSLEARSPDGIHMIEMERGTRALDRKGFVVKQIAIRESDTPNLPENTIIIGKPYNFLPSDITFDKPIRITLGYNVDELPDNVVSVSLAYYTAETYWSKIEAESDIVAEVGKLTALVDHFSTFAILAEVAPPQTPLTPQAPPPPKPSPPPAPAVFQLTNLSITPSLSKVWQLLTFAERIGEEVTIVCELSNNGGQVGSSLVTLKMNGTTKATKQITLKPGQTEKVLFTITGNEPGHYIVQIGGLTGEFASLLWINWWLIGGFSAAFILLCCLVWYYLYYRRKRLRYTV